MMRRYILAFVAFLLAAGGTPVQARQPADCLNGLRPALIAGSFSGSPDCSHGTTSVRKLGSVQRAGAWFTVYDYRYRARGCDGCAVHYGRRIIFMKNGRYIGQYGVLAYDGKAAMRGGNLVLTPGPDSIARMMGIRNPVVVVRLTANGPPRRILYDGDDLELFR